MPHGTVPVSQKEEAADSKQQPAGSETPSIALDAAPCGRSPQNHQIMQKLAQGTGQSLHWSKQQTAQEWDNLFTTCWFCFYRWACCVTHSGHRCHGFVFNGIISCNSLLLSVAPTDEFKAFYARLPQNYYLNTSAIQHLWSLDNAFQWRYEQLENSMQALTRRAQRVIFKLFSLSKRCHKHPQVHLPRERWGELY